MPLVAKVDFAGLIGTKLIDTKIMPALQRIAGISYIESVYVFDQVDPCSSSAREAIERLDLTGLLYSNLVLDWDLVDLSFHEIMDFANQQLQS